MDFYLRKLSMQIFVYIMQLRNNGNGAARRTHKKITEDENKKSFWDYLLKKHTQKEQKSEDKGVQGAVPSDAAGTQATRGGGGGSRREAASGTFRVSTGGQAEPLTVTCTNSKQWLSPYSCRPGFW